MFSVLRTLGRRLADIVAECNYAQRRLAELKASPDYYMLDASQAPDTYAAFLYRTSGALMHEPSAAQRSCGRLVG